jgi:hypothetical protein
MSDGGQLLAIAGSAPTPMALGSAPLLAQHLVTCPECNLLSAVHVDPQSWLVVRFVCPSSCVVDPAAVAALIAPEPAALSA